MRTFQPTQEQKAIADYYGNARVLAYAGTGKTATLVYYAALHRNSNILYIAYNRSVKLEAVKRFRDAGAFHVRVETAHSLAYKAINVGQNFTLTQSGNLKVSEIVNLCGLYSTEYGGKDHYVLARHIQAFLSMYCNSAATHLDEIDYLSTITDPVAYKFVESLEDDIRFHVQNLFGQMYRNEIPITHDAYLKFFQLKGGRLPYGTILIDEAQDANQAMLDIFLKQDHAVKILVGDPHQQIYGFRGALNSLDKVDYPRFALTQSFRFDQGIADTAIEALRLKELIAPQRDQIKIMGLGGQAPINSQTILARTNISLLSEAVDVVLHGGKDLHFEGGLENYTYMSQGASLDDVLALRLCQKGKIRNPFIKSFPDFDALLEYSAAAADKELDMVTGIVNKFGAALMDYIRRLKHLQVEKEKARHIFATCHKSKGQQYPHVVLTDDFMTGARLRAIMKKAEEKKRSGRPSFLDTQYLTEEINLVYVALTRSSNELIVPFDIGAPPAAKAAA